MFQQLFAKYIGWVLDIQFAHKFRCSTIESLLILILLRRFCYPPAGTPPHHSLIEQYESTLDI